MEYTFDWDPRKAESNLAKHRVSFQNAAGVFLDPLQVAIPDEEHSEAEERWVTIGKAKDGILLVVAHTFAENDHEIFVRIISARRATRHEQRQYEEMP